jgi:tRNA threonylcarbamoyladenosine biosynthesis protein TsaB
MLVAIDTATRIMSIALHDGDNLLAEQTWLTNNRHTIDLAPTVAAMLATCEVDLEDLVGVGVSVGPGSYTGVRIGVAFAKGLAAPRNLPLVGVTTADTIAAAQNYQSGAGLVTVIPAGRGRIIVQSYRWRKGEWSGRTEPRLITWDELFASIDGPALIAGEINSDGLAAIRKAQESGIRVQVAPAANRMRRAGYIAQVAWDRLRQAAGDLEQFVHQKLAPVYVSSDGD